MKLYISESKGTYFWLEPDTQDLMFAPICIGDHMLDTENDGGQVDWSQGVESPQDEKDLKAIERELHDFAQCPNCDTPEKACDIAYLGDQKFECPNCKNKQEEKCDDCGATQTKGKCLECWGGITDSEPVQKKDVIRNANGDEIEQ